jgi:hypothetical protein
MEFETLIGELDGTRIPVGHAFDGIWNYKKFFIIR